MQRTKNYNLKKPDYTDFYNVDDFNENMEVIDESLKNFSESIKNVPNVATNDQTPTYSRASTLAELVSGEKLSTAFGKISKAVRDLISHIANKSNPHEVTKAQVGLGSVPNVGTNDHTPTYTTASTLSGLASGEKLSVAFGKIAKAIADLISHLANKNNPHGVTADQVGALSLTASNTEITLSDLNTAQRDLRGYITPTVANAIALDSCYYSVISQYNGGNRTQLFIPISSNTNMKMRVFDANTVVYVGDLKADYLPMAGGELRGELGVSGGIGVFTASPDGALMEQRETAGNTDARRGFWVRSASTAKDLLYSFLAFSTVNGVTTTYTLHGEHNKPTGKYIGNAPVSGSPTSRDIQVGGIGKALMLSSNHGYSCLVTDKGAICMKSTETTVSAIPYSEIHFVDGVLTINSKNTAINNMGSEYYYQVL